MPLNLPYSINPVNPVPVDGWSGPYTASNINDAITKANASIPIGVRFNSMEVRLIINDIPYKYWYYGGVSASNLVPIVTQNFVLTTTGSQGPSTFTNSNLNIPDYTLNGKGLVYSNFGTISYIYGSNSLFIKSDG